MTTATRTRQEPDGPAPTGTDEQPRRTARPVRVIVGALGMAITAWFVCNAFLAFAYYPQWFASSGILIGILGLVVGILGSLVFFYFLNICIEGFPARFAAGLIPYAFLLPGFSLIGIFLLYPTVQTIVYSFANDDSTGWVGLENYRAIFSSAHFWSTLLNNFLWILIVPVLTVAFGLAVAVLADKLSPAGENVGKSMIFLPMAISFVGAATIWGLVYAYNSPGEAQTGLLNAIVTAVGGEPQPWYQIDTARLNSLALMVILIWLQTGFAMVLISSAIKGVPEDTVEAGRVDGASEIRIFWQIVFPQVRPTLIAVLITVLILVLKVFDLIYVTTNGLYDSDVIANLFFRKLFTDQQAGQASAIVVVLLILVLPILVYQVRSFRQQEANR
ncbi:carbohydrate ABC transporter permease [Brachybacterium sacelli]|uniref:Alpha-glucoside transport system permease protein n=1 Tax=Brachybacterium sacelli TaxID=173364 RepID=A0ABS4X3C4_9MICO|nr:sugar ABC transporter permease [Brachybacterium sacelli]MBP2382965.1 alpha-glucoside transport system permease protein [Brachybacterium sacelli]